jgi:16S rRNA (guanine527-N7)-methyltransferase
MNLTRITDPVEAAVKHYADSLALLLWVRERAIAVQNILDVGTGAGFPAIPLAVLRPDWSVTAIDATGKKIEFVRRTATELGLTNIRCEHAHSRHWRVAERFSPVVFRALTALPAALESTSRYVSQRGWLVAYRTASDDPDERQDADRAATGLDLEPQEPFAYELHAGDEVLRRVLRVYQRVG